MYSIERCVLLKPPCISNTKGFNTCIKLINDITIPSSPSQDIFHFPKLKSVEGICEQTISINAIQYILL